MKSSILRKSSLTFALLVPLTLAIGCSESGNIGTSHEVSHTESDTTGWFGGQTHEANTVYKNSDGSTSVETETRTEKNGTTTIVREKKTTNVDGTVKTEHEKHVIVKGSDNVEHETKVSS